MKRLLIPLLLLSAPAWADNIEFHTEKVGAWTISGYADENTKEFSHCVALTEYFPRTEQNRKLMRTSAMALFVKLLANENIAVSFAGMDWNFPVGKTYNMKFDFANGAKSNVDGVSVNPQVITAEIPADKESAIWYVELARNEWVELYIEGRTLGRFNLTDSRKALEMLMSCYEGTKEAIETNKDNTFGGGRD